jgi:hypothetical protein
MLTYRTFCNLSPDVCEFTGSCFVNVKNNKTCPLFEQVTGLQICWTMSQTLTYHKTAHITYKTLRGILSNNYLPSPTKPTFAIFVLNGDNKLFDYINKQYLTEKSK